MVTNQSSIDSIETVAQRARLRRGRWFFAGLTSTLLATVLAGFAPTFYLRPLFHQDFTLPLYLLVHGLLQTVWYSLLMTQSFLVARERADIHRRLGVAGVVIAALIVPLSVLVTMRMVPRGIAAGYAPSELGPIIIGNALVLVVFVVFVTMAVMWRRRLDWHKRLIIGSSVLMLMPALDRLRWFPGAPLVPFFGLLAALWLYDYRALGRIHRATVVITVVIMTGFVTMQTLLQTSAVQIIVNALK